MKISLVIRTLNEEDNIGKCLSAVLLQSRLPDEVLVVDNCSNDRTIEIVKEFEDKFTLRIFSNPDINYTSGLNLGAENARYEAVGFLSADCYPEPEWLEQLVAVMEKNKAAVVMGREEVRGDKDIHYVLRHTRPHSEKDQIITFFENSNIIYEKEILKKMLPFSGIGSKKGGEDTLLSIQYAENNYKAMRAGQAVVTHDVYSSMDDFKSRTIQQGERLSEFFHHDFRYPRTYLNPFYWSLVEFFSFFCYWDRRFLKISYLRLRYIFLGMMKK